MNPKTTNLINLKGNTVKNQFETTTKDSVIFTSYSTTIAIRNRKTGEVVLDTKALHYSNTTSGNLSIFLGVSASSIRQNISAGIYQTEDLNK